MQLHIAGWLRRTKPPKRQLLDTPPEVTQEAWAAKRHLAAASPYF